MKNIKNLIINLSNEYREKYQQYSYDAIDNIENIEQQILNTQYYYCVVGRKINSNDEYKLSAFTVFSSLEKANKTLSMLIAIDNKKQFQYKIIKTVLFEI